MIDGRFRRFRGTGRGGAVANAANAVSSESKSLLADVDVTSLLLSSRLLVVILVELLVRYCYW